MGNKRPRCLSCKKYLTSWGRTPHGKKRYGCHTCGKTRVYRRNLQKPNFFILFRQYVFWGDTYEQLSDQSGYAIQYLQVQFQVFFAQDPPELPTLNQSETAETFLLLDGLWLKRGFILMAYRQSRNLRLLHISVVGREAATKIAKDLKYLILLGYRFTGIVSDGGKGIVSAVNEVFPRKPHQICLAHLHRDVINAIGRYPKSERVRELKLLADHVWLIESKEALKWWKKQVAIWVESHNIFLKERKYDLDYNCCGGR